jgi:agmatine deiminase
VAGTPNGEWRWPAEWEPHAATWLAWPHNPETWPGRLEEAREAFARFVALLARYEPVQLLVPDADVDAAAWASVRSAGLDDESRLTTHRVPTNDSWLRDSGPIFVEKGDEVAAVEFGFDAWGGKYPPWDLDAAVPEAVCGIVGGRRFVADFVLEGGSIDGNGAGAILTTESCLLNPNREPGRTRESMERRLGEWLGARQVLWLADGIAGDDTDGHIDDLARFVDTTTVVAVEETDSADPNHAVLAANLARLRSMRLQDGRPLAVATLPMPPPLVVDGLRCPASYANFYLANGCALVPTFDVPADARALAVLGELLPRRDVVPLPARALVQGLGALHCLSQQQPA